MIEIRDGPTGDRGRACVPMLGGEPLGKRFDQLSHKGAQPVGSLRDATSCGPWKIVADRDRHYLADSAFCGEPGKRQRHREFRLRMRDGRVPVAANHFVRFNQIVRDWNMREEARPDV
ncbi:hypothetical protein [Microbacterium hominis]|uniref:Uncharacterized protein n=1 Tax=Microbacterium hominis TaxID=162426 RepID=A0A7D4TNK9_9MICO|nr:hypothetical protein [Microbacterium hominis]QKJ19742.1 hypothetical protein HQM25_10455 [Microbacterium hominis]